MFFKDTLSGVSLVSALLPSLIALLGVVIVELDLKYNSGSVFF